jgi:hypothetical protein
MTCCRCTPSSPGPRRCSTRCCRSTSTPVCSTACSRPPRPSSPPASGDRHQGHRPARPLRQGRQDRPVRRRRRRQDRAHPGADQQRRQGARRLLGVRRRRRAHPRGQRPLVEMGVRPASSGKTALVFGQMNEPPGARAARRAVGLTMAEYFRDVQKPGRAALRRQHLPLHPGGLGGVGAAGPHAVGRGLPADAGHEMGALQERITSTKKGSITSVQAIYVPADD